MLESWLSLVPCWALIIVSGYCIICGLYNMFFNSKTYKEIGAINFIMFFITIFGCSLFVLHQNWLAYYIFLVVILTPRGLINYYSALEKEQKEKKNIDRYNLFMNTYFFLIFGCLFVAGVFHFFFNYLENF